MTLAVVQVQVCGCVHACVRVCVRVYVCVRAYACVRVYFCTHVFLYRRVRARVCLTKLPWLTIDIQ